MSKPFTLLLTFVFVLFSGLSALAQSDFKGLPEAASGEAKKWAVVFDFDTDSCYPAPAISKDGTMNGGLNPSGQITGGCRQLDQFKNANTYYRMVSIEKDGVKYSVHMYALYFGSTCLCGRRTGS
jgi:hypothetical protein